MSTLIGLLLALHGLGHLLFVVNAWGYWNAETGRSWLFGVALRSGRATEGVFGLLWLAPVSLFLLGAWLVLVEQSGARVTLAGAAVLSSLMIVSWWGSLVRASAVLALLLNVAIVALVLFWPETATAPGRW